jgi:hypothetical protein
MNKYRKGFTPDEAALIAVNLSDNNAGDICAIDLSSYSSLEKAKSKINEIIDELTLTSETSLRLDEAITQDTLKSISDYEMIARLLDEAEDIKKALIDETWRAYEIDSHKQTTLEIYQEFFSSSDCDVPMPEKTQLTKESLADWFAGIGEKEISKRFRPVKQSVRINPFTKKLTAEHAALIAVGLHEYRSIENAERCAEQQEYSIAEAKWQVEKGDYFDDLNVDERLEGSLISNAISLKEAIIEEIELASEMDKYRSSLHECAEIGVSSPPQPRHTDIIIYREESDHENTLITKESLATWLWRNGHNKYAVDVLPSIKKLLEEKESAESQIKQQPLHSIKSAFEDEKPVKTIRTPESSLMDSLGIMAWLLSEKSSKFKRGDKPNSSQIKTAVESAIANIGLDKDTDNKIMISNLNKDITTALEQISNKFKL